MKASKAIPVVIAILVMACNSTKPVDPLTERQAVALLRELAALTVADDLGRRVNRCPLGGRATVVFTRNERETGDTLRFSGNWVVTPSGCGLRADNDTLTVNGNPGVTFSRTDARITGSSDEVEVKLTATGAVTWRRLDDSSDTCELDLTLESNEVDEDTGVVGDLKGSLCGLDVVIDIAELD